MEFNSGRGVSQDESRRAVPNMGACPWQLLVGGRQLPPQQEQHQHLLQPRQPSPSPHQAEAHDQQRQQQLLLSIPVPQVNQMWLQSQQHQQQQQQQHQPQPQPQPQLSLQQQQQLQQQQIQMQHQHQQQIQQQQLQLQLHQQQLQQQHLQHIPTQDLQKLLHNRLNIPQVGGDMARRQFSLGDQMGIPSDGLQARALAQMMDGDGSSLQLYSQRQEAANSDSEQQRNAPVLQLLSRLGYQHIPNQVSWGIAPPMQLVQQVTQLQDRVSPQLSSQLSAHPNHQQMKLHQDVNFQPQILNSRGMVEGTGIPDMQQPQFRFLGGIYQNADGQPSADHPLYTLSGVQQHNFGTNNNHHNITGVPNNHFTADFMGNRGHSSASLQDAAGKDVKGLIASTSSPRSGQNIEITGRQRRRPLPTDAQHASVSSALPASKKLRVFPPTVKRTKIIKSKLWISHAALCSMFNEEVKYPLDVQVQFCLEGQLISTLFQAQVRKSSFSNQLYVTGTPVARISGNVLLGWEGTMDEDKKKTLTLLLGKDEGRSPPVEEKGGQTTPSLSPGPAKKESASPERGP